MNQSLFTEQLEAMRGRVTTLNDIVTGSPADLAAAIPATFAELSTAMEELRVADEEIRQQNEELLLAQIQIEEQRRRYQELFEFAPDAYLVTDPNGIIRAANRATARLFNISQSFLTGKPIANYIAERDRQAFRWKLLRLRAPDLSRPLAWETCLQPRKSAQINVALSVAPVRTADGTLESIRWLARDITEHKQMEERIRRLNAELEQRVAERTVQLEATLREQASLPRAEQAARTEAASALRVQDAILGVISQGFGDPTASIKGFVQVLRRLAKAWDSPVVSILLEGLSGIDTAAGQTARLSQDLIDLAHLPLGQRPVMERIDLVGTVASTVERLQSQSRRHTIRAEMAAAELWGMADRTRVERVLDILFSNAIKYSPEGGDITVSLREDQDRVQRWAVLTVRDEGVGIPPADQLHILEHFHRGANVSGWTTGAGIGLIVARFLVEQHRGTITIASKHGAGATVTVRLPIT